MPEKDEEMPGELLKIFPANNLQMMFLSGAKGTQVSNVNLLLLLLLLLLVFMLLARLSLADNVVRVGIFQAGCLSCCPTSGSKGCDFVLCCTIGLMVLE